MNAVLLFETLGVLPRVRWVSKDKRRVRITRRRGTILTIEVELPFCGTWIQDRPWQLEDFLTAHKPLR